MGSGDQGRIHAEEDMAPLISGGQTGRVPNGSSKATEESPTAWVRGEGREMGEAGQRLSQDK